MSIYEDDDGIDGPWEKAMAEPIPCPASREAVEEQDDECPLCGKGPDAHPSEVR